MHKVTFMLILLSLFITFSVRAASLNLKSYSLKLEHLSNRTKGSTEELSWNDSTKKCQGHYDSLPWKPLPEQSCRDLALMFDSKHSSLVALQKSAPKQKHPALHHPRGRLVWTDSTGNYEWIVNLATAPECTDPELKNCHEVQLDEGSTLAEKLRELLTQTLGRLPIPSRPK